MAKIDNVLIDLKLVVGEAKMTLKELEELGVDSIIELEELAGEPCKLYAGDVHIANGEVVVVREKYGVRIKEVLNAT